VTLSDRYLKEVESHAKQMEGMFRYLTFGPCALAALMLIGRLALFRRLAVSPMLDMGRKAALTAGDNAAEVPHLDRDDEVVDCLSRFNIHVTLDEPSMRNSRS
jgi:methyl-accepting chemotaxis protein